MFYESNESTLKHLDHEDSPREVMAAIKENYRLYRASCNHREVLVEILKEVESLDFVTCAQRSELQALVKRLKLELNVSRLLKLRKVS